MNFSAGFGSNSGFLESARDDGGHVNSDSRVALVQDQASNFGRTARRVERQQLHAVRDAGRRPYNAPIDTTNFSQLTSTTPHKRGISRTCCRVPSTESNKGST